jgi:DNA-binding GntR family transcriptional regulator
MISAEEQKIRDRRMRLRGGKVARSLEGAIPERHASPALRALPACRLQHAPFHGARALIYASLWRLIAEGRLRPGTRLLESDFERVFTVSRGMVLPAFERLAQEGLLVASQGRGFLVVSPSPEAVRQLFDMLGLVIAHAIGVLVSRAEPLAGDDRALIARHLAAMAEAEATNEIFTACLMGRELLILLAAFAGDVMVTSLVAHAVALQTLSLRLYGRFPQPIWSAEAQSELIEAICDHKAETATGLFRSRHDDLYENLWFKDTGQQGDEDITSLLISLVGRPG